MKSPFVREQAGCPRRTGAGKFLKLNNFNAVPVVEQRRRANHRLLLLRFVSKEIHDMYPNRFMIRLTKELVGETHPRLRVPPERRRLTTDAGMRADHTGEEEMKGVRDGDGPATTDGPAALVSNNGLR